MRFRYTWRILAKLFANSGDADQMPQKAQLFANGGDPDQTPHSAASDLGFHCLPITLFRVSRQQCDKHLDRLTLYCIYPKI